jgi:hypothetical protein
MRITLSLALLLVLPAVAAADDTFKSKDGHFSVRFPGKPKEATQTVKTEAGDLKVHTFTYATPDGSVFLVSYVDYPEAVVKAGTETLLDGARDGLVGKDGKLLPEKKVEVGREKLPGREFVIDRGKVQTRARVVVKDRRLFQLMAVGTGGFVTGSDATDFFKSFQFAK